MVFYFWMRKQIRKVTKPIPLKTAEKYDSLFTHLYVLSAWSCLGILMYSLINHRRETKQDPFSDIKSSGFYYGRVFQAPNMQIYKLSNGTFSKEAVYEAANDLSKVETDDEFFGEERT